MARPYRRLFGAPLAVAEALSAGTTQDRLVRITGVGTSRLASKPQLDGLRALAVLAVMLFHSAPFLPGPDYHGGARGVDVFFVLSGFLITTVLLHEKRTTGGIGLVSFYERRAVRLLPALVLAVAVAALAVSRLGTNPDTAMSFSRSAFLALTYLGNWAATRQSLGILGHTWTLAIEEQYYILWPVALVISLRWLRSTRRIARGLAAIALAVAIARAVVFALGYPVLAAISTATRSDGVLIGSALALLLAGDAPRLRAALGRSSVGAAAAAIVFGLSLLAGWVPLSIYGGLAVLELAAAVLIGHLAVGTGTPLIRALSVRPLRALGRISYGLYLYHVPLHYWIHGAPARLDGGIPSVVAMFACSLALATASYFLVEQPALRLRAFLRSRAPLPHRARVPVAA